MKTLINQHWYSFVQAYTLQLHSLQIVHWMMIVRIPDALSDGGLYE